ncbi:hypothetical protein F183_A22870 [Bryobacterales bacterium F-183]|nr:hypothetical protein F183_A22870 [Bryobacterales bacterium F-183]
MTIATLREQFAAIREDAAGMICDHSKEQLTWRPAPEAWSMAEQIAHLNSLNGQDLPVLFQAIAQAKRDGKKAAGGQSDFTWPWLDRMFIRMMEPPYRMRLKTPKQYTPKASDTDPHEAYVEFERIHNDLDFLMQDAAGLDLLGVRIVSPASKWVKMSLGGRLALLAAHDRRHLWAMHKIARLPSFPKKD